MGLCVSHNDKDAQLIQVQWKFRIETTLSSKVKWPLLGDIRRFILQWNLSKADIIGAKNLTALDRCRRHREISHLIVNHSIPRFRVHFKQMPALYHVLFRPVPLYWLSIYSFYDFQCCFQLLYCYILIIVFLFLKAIVFVVGGGNYIEYANLLNYEKVCSSYWLHDHFCFLIVILLGLI